MGKAAGSIGALLVACVLLFAGGCDNPGGAPPPTPETLLRRTLEHLEGLSSVRLSAELTVRMKARGADQTMTSKSAVRFQRPDRFALVAEEGMMGFTIISDGKKTVQYFPVMNRYSISEAGKDAAGAGPIERVLLGGANTGIVNSFDASEMYEQIMDEVTDASYIGVEQVDGVDCHHCRYNTKEAAVDVWFEDGDQPLIRKLVPDLSKVFENQGAENESIQDMQFHVEIVLKDWDTNASLTDADFAFTPPPGAEQVDSLFGGIAGGRDEGPHPLLGQPAPEFEAVDLDGNRIALASYLGNNVIVLDFWATWCGPCVEALPEIADVASQWKDRGVVFYAINLGEEKQTVVDFLSDQGLDIPVALDPDAEVGSLYQASAIPQTVLIGKDQKVQVVHVGYSPGIKAQLVRELEQLLEGKDLAGEALAQAKQRKAERAERQAQVGGHEG